MKKLIAVTLLMSVLCSGCSPFGWIAGIFKTTPEGTKSESKKDEESLYIKEPVVVGQNSRGKDIVRYRIFKHHKNSADRTVVKPERTFMQKAGDWIGGLGLMTVILVTAGLIIAPGATITMLFRWGKRNAKTLTRVVRGVKESGAIEEGNGLHKALSDNLDEWMEKHIKQIKVRL